MAILDRESKIIYTGENIAWLPYVIQNGNKFYFRYKNGKAISLDTLEQYKKEASLIGYKVVELEEIYKEFEVEIIEIGKSAVLIDGVIVDCASDGDGKNKVLSFVKIACKLDFCNSKNSFAHRKIKLKKSKRDVTELEVFLDIRKNNSTKKYNARANNGELQRTLKQNGLKYSTYKNRVKRGWDRYKAMTTPPMPAHKSTLKESVDHEGSEQLFTKLKEQNYSKETLLLKFLNEIDTEALDAKRYKVNYNRAFELFRRIISRSPTKTDHSVRKEFYDYFE